MIAAVAIVALVVGGGGSSSSTATTTTLSLAAKTSDIAALLQKDLCPSSASSSYSCDAESSGAGAVAIHISSYAVSEAALQRAGQDSHLWSNADVARMLTTRALDGTQRTPDGKVSWTYHPDNGLNIVITVDDTTAFSSSGSTPAHSQ